MRNNAKNANQCEENAIFPIIAIILKKGILVRAVKGQEQL
jgi:hypothetical protein